MLQFVSDIVYIVCIWKGVVAYICHSAMGIIGVVPVKQVFQTLQKYKNKLFNVYLVYFK